MGDLHIIGERIKHLRIENDKTQRDICDSVHIEQVTLSQYETGKRVPKLDILISLAQYFNVSLDFLVGLNSSPTATEQVNTNNFSHEEEVMIDSFHKLSFDNQYIIIGKTKELLKEQHSNKNTDSIPLKKVE